jgi:chromosome segregation ATPase
MAARILALAFLASPLVMASGSQHRPLPSFLEAAKERPVTKVVNLLKDMQKQLQKEAEEDEEIYEKLACWCETNDKAKTKAVADAEAHIDDLTTQIEELAALSARLNTEIKNLGKEVAENQEALDTAIAMRAKELAEFNTEEKDMLLAIAALKAAITVLAKNHEGGAALTQMATNQVMQTARTVNHIWATNAAMLDGVFTVDQRQALSAFIHSPVSAFIQSPEDYFDAEPTFKQSYAPQSGQIFGILKQMKETFESNMADSQKSELENQKKFEALKTSKEEEIAAGQEQIDTKTQELATADEKLAAAKKDLEDTKAGMAADEEFLLMLKEKCQGADQEYEERQKTRKLEIEAVSKALAFLTSDEARDLFSKTFNPEFVQEAAVSKRQTEAAKLLTKIAQKTRNPRLMTLATSVKLNPFTKVKKAIDDMVQQLLKEKQDEIKLKDFCRESFHENEMNVEKKTREKKDFIKTIKDLEATIGMLEKAIETLKAEVAELNTQLKRAGEDREKENKEFQLTVADQRATVKLLNMALKVLEGVYGKKAKAMALAQGSQAPPPGFKEYKKNAASGGVMGMIGNIIQDAKELEAEATRAEADAQKAYEEFVAETQKSVDEKSKDIVNKSEEKAKAEEDKTTAEQAKEDVVLELDQLANEALDLHKTCDFVVDNFDIRQSARDEEIEGLKKAKAILSGAKFSEFIQYTETASE